jgi:hypothetical protein
MTIAAASLPTMWYGRSWRAPSSDSRANRSRNANVGRGSKIDVHTVLKFSADAIGAMSTSLGPSGGIGTSSTWSDLRGSFSCEGRPSKIPASSLRINAARIDSGSGVAAISSGVDSGESAVSRRARSASVIDAPSD